MATVQETVQCVESLAVISVCGEAQIQTSIQEGPTVDTDYMGVVHGDWQWNTAT